MKQRLMNKAVTTQDGTDVGTVKDVIVRPHQQDIILEVSKGPLRGEAEIPWTQIVSIGDRIVLKGEATEGRSATMTSNPQNNPKKHVGSIEVLYYSDCPHYRETLQTIQDLLSEEGLSADVRTTNLTENTQAEKPRSSASSPTVLLNGKDIAPPFDDYYGPRGGHCRIYEYHGEMYPNPPKELIRSALKRQSAKSEGARAKSGEQQETTKGQQATPEKQSRNHDDLGSPEAAETSQAKRHGDESPPRQTTDSIEERRNRQLEAGVPTERKEMRKQ